MGKKDELKGLMWEAGAEAFAKLGLNLPKMYVCPLCLHGGDKICLGNGYFTLEHVPPKAVGSKELVLTCRDCNSRAGHKLEGHLSEFEKLRREKETTGSVSLTGRLTSERVERLNVEVSISNDKVSVAGLPKNNRPEDHNAFFDDLDRRSRAGQGFPKFKLDYHSRRPIDGRKVDISWLKAGYLAAFSVFGYRWAVRPELKLVREQIKHPDEHLIEGFVFSQNADDGKRHVVLLREPEWARGIVVQMGRVVVLLPFAEEAETYYSRIASHDGEKLDLNGIPLDWPTKPLFELDHHPGKVNAYFRLIDGC